MDIESLRYFVAAAECGNITKTAEFLYTTQPNITRHIKRVEKEIGCKLFDKKGQGVVLNENGKKVLADSKIILKKYDKMKADISEKTAINNSTITIGYSGELKSDALIGLSKSFNEKNPDINLIFVKQVIEPELLKMLLNDDVDAIVASGTSGIHSEKNICSKTVVENNVVLVVPKTHRLSGKNIINRNDLFGEKIIITPRKLNPIFYDWALSNVLYQNQDVSFEEDLETMMVKAVFENRIAVISKMYADYSNKNIAIIDYEYDKRKIDVNLLLSWKKQNNQTLEKITSIISKKYNL